MDSNPEGNVQAHPGRYNHAADSDKIDTRHRSSHYKDWPNASGVRLSQAQRGKATDLNKFNALGDCRTSVPLSVSGQFPPYVAGSLFRTGPGSYKIPRKENAGTFAVSHWFDGFNTVHKFDIATDEDGNSSIRYSSYGQVDEAIEHARSTGRLDGITFGQKRDPCDSLYRKFKTMFQPFLPGSPNSMNIGVTLRNVLPAEKAGSDANGQQTMTLTTDSHQSKTFDADTLEPLGVTDQRHLHPALTGPVSAAHAAIDPTTGDVFNFNLAFGAKQTYRVFRASLDGEVQILAEISGLDVHGAYIHSLFLTPNFVILCIWPLHFRKQGIDILWQRNLMDAMCFDDSAKTVWLVVDRRYGRGVVKKLTSAAFFCFHSTNAWEEMSDRGQVDVVCELVQFKNADILQKFYYENLVSDEHQTTVYNTRGIDTTASLSRYRLRDIPLDEERGKRLSHHSSSTAELIMKTPAGDLPSINPAFKMKPHRYVWSIIDRGLSSFVDGLVKTDTTTGAWVIWDQPRHTPGEPVFIPRPGTRDEDDGVILAVVLDGDTGNSYLLCLDARSMKEIGRADVGRAVGLGFHGIHVADQQQHRHLS